MIDYTNMYETDKEIENDSIDETVQDNEPINETVQDNEPINETVQEEAMGHVDCDLLNVRTGPGSHFEVVKQISKNEEVLVISGFEPYSEWYNVVTASGVEGYVMKQYIKLI